MFATSLAGHTWHPAWVPVWAQALVSGLLLAAGCATQPLPVPTSEDAGPYSVGAIQMGDLIKVSFPGAPNLNFSGLVREDGLLSVGQGGDLGAADKAPKELEADLLTKFGPDLIDKRVNVVVESAAFPIFVSGAVLRPGELLVNRSVTVLEAIMKAGGFDAKRANLEKVKIIRQEKGVQRTFVIDVQSALNNPRTRPFHLRRSDVVIVPERFVFF